jgi:hypothetical protein
MTVQPGSDEAPVVTVHAAIGDAECPLCGIPAQPFNPDEDAADWLRCDDCRTILETIQ